MDDSTLTMPATGPFTAGRATTQARTGGPLLVATTGRDATAVVTAARVLAGQLGATPEVLAVHDPLPVLLPGPVIEPMHPDLVVEQRRWLQADVERALASAYDGDPAWPIQVVEGQPARAIAHVARERRAQMIVMGLGRHAPMDRVFGSETALQVIRVADRPVLAVAPTFAALPRHVAVAMDFSPASVRAAEEALALLADGGRLSLVYVRPRDIDLVRLGDAVVSWRHGDRVTGLFERLLAALPIPPWVTVHTVVREGEPADRVLGFAEDEGVDLIATGSSGLGFLDRLIVGSVATRLLRRTTVSLLVVPRPPAADVVRIERLLADTTESADAALWPAILDAFTARNASRRTQLEIDDPELGAQLLQTGYTLLGASYDRRDRRLALMFEAPVRGAPHLTHTIGDVMSVAVIVGPGQRDQALQVRHGRGQTILSIGD